MDAISANPALRLFEPVVDRSIQQTRYVEVFLRDQNYDQRQVTIETKDSDALLWFHKAALEVRGRVVQQDGADYDVGTSVALANGGWSLFETVQLQANNKVVDELLQHTPVVNTIMQLTMASDEYARSTATNALWYKDTGAPDAGEFAPSTELLAAADVANNTAVTGALFRKHFHFTRNAARNRGFAARNILCAGAKDVTMMLPLSDVLGFVRDIDSAVLGMMFGLHLTRARAENSNHRASGVAAGRFLIKHISLWASMIEPSLAVQTSLESKLAAGYTRELVRERRTQRHLEVTMNASEDLPTHVFVAFQAAARDGDQEETIHVFENADLRRITTPTSTPISSSKSTTATRPRAMTGHS